MSAAPPTAGAGAAAAPPTAGAGAAAPASPTRAAGGASGSAPACDPCALGEECCNGRCVNLYGSDVNHCGACGNVCGTGAKPGCCGGVCVDFTADQTCGSCDMACGLLNLGGIACKCGTLDGQLGCVGVALGQVLQLCL
jgi:hypothetical protein